MLTMQYSIRGIDRGIIYLLGNPDLCYWKPLFQRIDFTKLLGEYGARSIHNDYPTCKNSDNYKCDAKCGIDKCWGPDESMCATCMSCCLTLIYLRSIGIK